MTLVILTKENMVLVFLKLAGRMWCPLNSGTDVGLLDPGGGPALY